MPHILGVKLTSQQHYNEAVKLYEDGDYDGAKIHFGLIDDTDVVNVSNASIYLERILRRHPETAELTRLGAAATEQDFVNQVNNRIAIAARLKQEGDQTGSYVNYQKALDLASEGMRQIRMGGGTVAQLDALRKSLRVPGVMPDYRFAPDAESTSAVQELVGTAPTSPDTVTQADDTKADILQTSYVDIMGEDAEPPRSAPREYMYQTSQLLGGIDPETGRPAFGTAAMRAAQRGLESGFQSQFTRWLLESAAQPVGQVTQFDDWLTSQGIQRPTGDKLPAYWEEVIRQSSLLPTLSEQQAIEFIDQARAIPLFGTPTADGTGFTRTLSDEQKWAARAAMGGATTGLFGRINNQRFNSLLAAWSNLQNDFPDDPEYSSPQFLRWVVSQLTPDAPGYLENYSSRESWIAPPGGEDEDEAKKIAKSVSNVGINIGSTNVKKIIGDSSDSSETFLSSTSTPRYGYNAITGKRYELDSDEILAAQRELGIRPAISAGGDQPVETVTPAHPYEAWQQLVEEHTPPPLTGQALTDQEKLNLAEQQKIQEAFKEFVPAETSFGHPAQDPIIVLTGRDKSAYDQAVINAGIRAAGRDPYAQYEVELPMGSGGLTPNQEQERLNRLRSGIVQDVGINQAFVSRPLPDRYIPFTDPLLPLGDTSYLDTPGISSIPIGRWGHTGEFDISGPYGRSAWQQANIEARADRITPGIAAYKEQEIYNKALADANEKYRIDLALGKRPTYEQPTGAVNPWQGYDPNVPAIVPRPRTSTTGTFGVPNIGAVTDAFKWFMNNARSLPFG